MLPAAHPADPAPADQLVYYDGRSCKAVLERPDHLVTGSAKQRLSGDHDAQAQRISEQPILVPSAEHTQGDRELGGSRCSGEPQTVSYSAMGDVNHDVDSVAVHNDNRDFTLRVFQRSDGARRRVAREECHAEVEKNGASPKDHDTIVPR